MKARYPRLTISVLAPLALCLPLAVLAQADDTPVPDPQEADIYPEIRDEGVDEQTVRDMNIKSRIDDALAAEEVFDPARIDVKVENGVVHLAGEVPDDEARQLAERIARDAQYVSKVENELKIAKDEENGG